MLARSKDNIRKAIDFLIVLPLGSFFLYLIFDAVGNGRTEDTFFITTFILILGLLINKWLKPLTLTEQVERLKEEEIFLNEKIDYHTQMIASLKKDEITNNSSRKNEIDSHQRLINDRQARLEIINTQLGKIELITA